MRTGLFVLELLFHSVTRHRKHLSSGTLGLFGCILVGASLHGQVADRLVKASGTAEMQRLPSHHPQWANSFNDLGALAPGQELPQLTLTLSRSTEQEAAFERLLNDQHNPGSPDFHRWLSPSEIGDQFGNSQHDTDAVTAWLESQNLHVNWVSPSRMFIGFSGTAGNVGRAFQTEIHQYSVHGERRLSVSSEPMVPGDLAAVIQGVRGLYTIDERPAHHFAVAQASAPNLTLSNGANYMVPSDFETIYDLPDTLSGYQYSIGIVGRSRTDIADFDNFRQLTFNSLQNPTEIVPTSFGGVDPGPALTSPPASGVSTGDQGEATLDVLRAGSIATNSNLLLVVATNASGGISADAQYLVQTSPVPVQVMTISFGACESEAGPSGVNFWNTLFQQAAAEGISVFVSSGDSGASGCDANFSTLPTSPQPNSPNYICSSSYATCVGGTEFNDFSNPSLTGMLARVQFTLQ